MTQNSIQTELSPSQVPASEVEVLFDKLTDHEPKPVASFVAQNAAEQKAQFLSDDIHNPTHSYEKLIAIDYAAMKSGIEKATAVNVKTTEKKIVIPEGRNFSRDSIRGLVVHEIGVHMLRSVTGEQTNINPLRTGLAGYYDSEEGLGAVGEQALRGTYRVAGEGHYITAGLAYLDNKDFRDTFEIKWRLGALSKLKDGDELTEEAIDKARSAAYSGTNRIFRGTDTLPWFKDLAYYNGAESMWRYLEDHRGDDEFLTLLFMGKADPTDESHKRILLESKSK